MSFQPKKIIVPVDFSETGLLALEHAAFMARLTKSDLLLIHVLPLSEYHFEIPEPIMTIQNHKDIEMIVEKKLKELSDMVHDNYSITPSTFSARGNVATEVVQYAREEKADLIIMGTHGSKGFQEIFVGSNAYKVATLAPCPVLTVQTHAKKLGFTNIVLPIDRSAHSREKVETAVKLGSLYNAKIHILGLLEKEGYEHEFDKLQIVLDQVQAVIEKAGLTFTRHTIAGDSIAIEALKYGKSVDADLIIIMTDQESKVGGIFMGLFAGQIVNHSRIPVLSIKPHYHEFEGINLGGAYHFY